MQCEANGRIKLKSSLSLEKGDNRGGCFKEGKLSVNVLGELSMLSMMSFLPGMDNPREWVKPLHQAPMADQVAVDWP